MRKAEPEGNAIATTSGSIELRENRWDCVVLGASGFIGILPLSAWVGSIILALPDSFSKGGGSWQNGPIGIVVGIVFVIGMFALPIGVPISILRRRQKNGARLTWDDEGVVEYDGIWKRNAIPWSRMEVAHVVWSLRGRTSGGLAQDVVQLFDRSSNAVISAWQGAPDGTPIVRRRVIARDLPRVIEVLRNRNIPFSRAVDYTRAEDPERRRMTTGLLAVTRSGYALALIGPMTALPSGIAGVIITFLAAALLTWRAMPSTRELRIISARLRGDAAEKSSSNADPYREASAPPISIDPNGRREADQTKRRAIVAEVVMRFSFVALTLFAGIANAFVPK